MTTRTTHGPEAMDRLLTRLAIEELNVEFAYRVDHNLTDTVHELFTENGSYGRSSGERSTGREAIRAAYAGRREHGARTARHLFTNLHLVHESAHRVRGTTIMLLFAEDGAPPRPADALAVSDFEDVYERGDDGVWRYASRTIHSQFLATGRQTVLPLGRGATPQGSA